MIIHINPEHNSTEQKKKKKLEYTVWQVIVGKK